MNLPPIYLATVSAYSKEEARQRCIGVDVHDYLTKPVNVHTLRAIFETVYNEKFDAIMSEPSKSIDLGSSSEDSSS